MTELLSMIVTNPVLETRSQLTKSSRLRRLVHRYKKKPCSDCGHLKKGEMTYDHRSERGEKLFDVGSAGIEVWVTTNILLQEIAKCDVVCAACHRHREKLRLREGQKINPCFELLKSLAGNEDYAIPAINRVFRILRILSGGVVNA